MSAFYWFCRLAYADSVVLLSVLEMINTFFIHWCKVVADTEEDMMYVRTFLFTVAISYL